MSNYIKRKLYRLNQANKPTVWWIDYNARGGTIILSGLINGEKIVTPTNEPIAKLEKRYKDKLNDGYVFNDTDLSESEFVKTLKSDRFDSQGNAKPMKAQPYTPGCMTFPVLVQGKINGDRSTVKWIKREPVDMFDAGYDGCIFLSKSGIEYDIPHLQAKLNRAAMISPYIKTIPFDGELFIPNANVASISGACRNPSNPLHPHLSYIIFDIANQDKQITRTNILEIDLNKKFKTLDIHDDINKISADIYILKTELVSDEQVIIMHRDEAIANNYEGVILRDPSAYYGFGKRVKTMRKFKKESFGRFTVLNIKPRNEEDKLPIFVLRNDLNDDVFESSCNGSRDEQRAVLYNKFHYVGNTILMRYYERTINNIPLHTTVMLNNENN